MWHTQIDTLTSKNVCVVSIIIILISINSVYFKCSFAFTYSNALNDSGGPSDRAVSKAYVWGRSPAEIVGSSPTGDMDVCVLWVLSGRGLCDELITRPEESYWLWCVVVCDLEISCMRRPWPNGGCRAPKPKWHHARPLMFRSYRNVQRRESERQNVLFDWDTRWYLLKFRSCPAGQKISWFCETLELKVQLTTNEVLQSNATLWCS